MPDNPIMHAGKTVAYTVKQVADISGVSVRALRFYHELGLLKPSFHGANHYRFYEEPQLLKLQQILFYRELGFELKEIKRILSRADFEKVEALQGHRNTLEEKLARTRTLIATIDKTTQHLKGIKKMNSEEMFAGFHVAAGAARFDERIKLRDDSSDCKVSAKDTDGAMCAFEFTGTGSGPRHLHHDQDEWIYVLDGALHFNVADREFGLRSGESVFLPRKIAHAWTSVSAGPVKIIDLYQPAGNMEKFFREVGKYNGKTRIHEALSIDEFSRLFQNHGMDLVGPPLTGRWKVDEKGRIMQIV